MPEPVNTEANGANDKQTPEPKPGGLFEWEGKQLTTEEVKAELAKAKEAESRAREKEKGADEKFREASEGRKLKAMMDDLASANQGDVEAIKRLRSYPELERIGITKESVDALLKEMAGEGGAKPVTRDGWEDVNPEEVKANLRKQRLEDQDKLRASIVGALATSLDKDEVLGMILKNEQVPESAKKRIKETAEGFLTRRAQEARRAPDGGKSWKPDAQMFKEVAQEMRAYLKDLGWLGDETEGQADNKDRGRTGVVPSLGRSPLGGAGTSLHPKEPPKRPSSRDRAAYSKYIEQSLSYAEAMAGE